MKPQSGDVAVSKPKPIQSLQTALRAFSWVSDKPCHPEILLMFVLRAYLKEDLDVVRLPLYLVTEDAADITVLRTILVELLGISGIHVQTLSQNTLLQHFATESCLVQDLTVANEALFYQVRHLAYLRGIPGNLLSTGNAIYGDTVVLIPEEFAELVGLFGVVLRLKKQEPCCPALPTLRKELSLWGSSVEPLVVRLSKEACVRPTDLPQSRVIPGAVHRAYLFLAATARWLDANSGMDGFMGAVLECCVCSERGAYAKKSGQLTQSLIAYYLVPYITNPDNPVHCAQGYRLDFLSEHLRSCDAEYFSDINATELGKALMRMGVGTPRRYVFPGGKGKATRIWRTCVQFSVLDKSKMEETCHELQR